MQATLTRKHTIVSQSQEKLASHSAALEELMIRKQAVSAGMRQAEDGNVTTVAEQLMQASQQAGAFETGPCSCVCACASAVREWIFTDLLSRRMCTE